MLSDGRRYATPIYFLFKTQIALVATYLLCGLFNSSGFVLNFVLVALLMSADFWYCKVAPG